MSTSNSTICYDFHKDNEDLMHSTKQFGSISLWARQRLKYAVCLVILLSFVSFGLAIGALVMANKSTSQTMEILPKPQGNLGQVNGIEISNTIRSRKDCQDVAGQGFRFSGVYKITINNKTTPVYCDLNNDGGNWTVFQRRTGALIDFYKDWNAYRDGFGDLNTDFWLGLENIYQIARTGSYQLRINLEDFYYNRAYALYTNFSIGNETTDYMLNVGGYNGTANDGMSWHHNNRFSTKDRENDVHSTDNCAVKYHGAWWYYACFHSNLNGPYIGNRNSLRGIVWWYWKRNTASMKRTEMKIRRNN